MTQMLPPEVLNLINAALAEDQAFNDPTTQALIPDNIVGDGILRAKAAGVLAGGAVAQEVFHRIDPALEVNLLLNDGADLTPGRGHRQRARLGRLHSAGRAHRAEFHAAHERHRHLD